MRQDSIIYNGKKINVKIVNSEKENLRKLKLMNKIFKPIYIQVRYDRKNIEIRSEIFQNIEKQFLNKRLFGSESFSIEKLLDLVYEYELELTLSIIREMISSAEFSLKNLKTKYPLFAWNTYSFLLPYFEKNLNNTISKYPELSSKLPLASNSEYISFFELHKITSLVFDYGVYKFGRDSKFIQEDCHWLNEMSILHTALSQHRTIHYETTNEEKILNDSYLPLLYFVNNKIPSTENLSLQSISNLGYYLSILKKLKETGNIHQLSNDDIEELLQIKFESMETEFWNNIDEQEEKLYKF